MLKLVWLLCAVAWTGRADEAVLEKLLDEGGGEDEETIARISDVIMTNLDKFDTEGKGAVGKDSYGEFLATVIREGLDLPAEDGQAIRMHAQLLTATKAYAETKEADEIGVQEFYIDLIKDFTLFLEASPEHAPLLDFYYAQQEEKGVEGEGGEGPKGEGGEGGEGPKGEGPKGEGPKGEGLTDSIEL